MKIKLITVGKLKEKYLKERIDVFKGSKIFLDKNSKWNVDVLQERQEKLVSMLINNSL